MLPPEIRALEFLIGIWKGRGRGNYPTIDPFSYDEEVSFACPNRPFLIYQQRTADPAGEPLHTETGYLRVPGPGTVELILAQPSGIAEVHTGTVAGTSLRLRSTTVALAPTAKQVSGVERELTVAGDDMHYVLRLAAMGHAMQTHLEATLHRG